MRTESSLGQVNGHIVGRVLKEAVRRAMATIRRERLVFEATGKAGYDGEMNDVFTSADLKAQRIYVRTFEECFPDCGVIAEEEGLRVEPNGECRAYFTVDPLDGTKAFVRRQSHGIATMVALVDGTNIISAYVGDVMANEVFGYRPGSSKVHRITDLDNSEDLIFTSPFVKGEGMILLRDPPNKYSGESQKVISTYFKSHLIDGGSIGTWIARLWKREVAAVILPGFGYETPWDSTPIYGISKQLGYRFLEPGTNGWWPVNPSPVRETKPKTSDTLIIHQDDVQKFRAIMHRT